MLPAARDPIFQDISILKKLIVLKCVKMSMILLFYYDLLTKNEKGIETIIYRKYTHTGLYNKWESLSPMQYKKKCHTKLVTSFLPNLQLIPIDPQRISTY